MSPGQRAGLPHVEAATPAVLVLSGPVPRGEAASRLCAEVRSRLRTTGAGAIVVDLGGLAPPGLGTVDLLARLELTARRAGGRIRLRDPDPTLRALLDLAGLRFETERQPEQREPPRGVQEAVEPGDPAP
ncbi:STAS domain-containing protein [Streptomyces tagetis]|uniref:STAS domain-containing protein n=1 Tax=Streptomyces tagetis TaxID=2820809 RepID=A0A940XJC8_9ACTN|nr:STAS domain-containing protein [Streptomyces sp. RG38]MBQ0828517.1 STAS domain-containing protein [Streptomyces sp. RG38]